MIICSIHDGLFIYNIYITKLQHVCTVISYLNKTRDIIVENLLELLHYMYE